MPADRCAAVEPLLSAWLDGALTAREATAVAVHVDDCRQCQAEVEALRRVRQALRSLPVREVPLGLYGQTALRRRARAQATGWSASVRRAAMRVGSVAAAAVVLGLIAIGVGGHPEPRVPVIVDDLAADHMLRTGTTGVPAPLLVVDDEGG